MNKITIVASVLLMMSCLSSCSEGTQSVEWYAEHPEILKKEVEKCKLKPLVELAKDKHCMVIRQAQQEASYRQQRNAPPPNIEFK